MENTKEIQENLRDYPNIQAVRKEFLRNVEHYEQPESVIEDFSLLIDIAYILGKQEIQKHYMDNAYEYWKNEDPYFLNFTENIISNILDINISNLQNIFQDRYKKEDSIDKVKEDAQKLIEKYSKNLQEDYNKLFYRIDKILAQNNS